MRGKTYLGLQGLLADSLPDKFVNALIAELLARQGRTLEAMNPVERLCYQGNRGMGALEFHPTSRRDTMAKMVHIDELVHLASWVLAKRTDVQVKLDAREEKGTLDGLSGLMMVGTSAGGARAKCVIAYNETTREVRSGQLEAPEGFTHWFLKLDGVSAHRDKDLCDPQGYGAIEYTYSQMALDCGIEMSPCLLLRENGRAHFMTRRFDRGVLGEKLHMQSLCALMHLDFNLPRVHSYEQVFQAIRSVCKNPIHDLEQQFRRAVFNVVGRNQDDHTKNIAFLMDKHGQ